MKWFVNPYNTCLAFIPRCGSTAFARAILNQYYPELLPMLTDAHFPIGISEIKPQFICPFIYRPDNETSLALIRDPIERFKSGFSRASYGKTVDQIIDEMIDNNPVNVHIRKQCDRIAGVSNIILYKFPVAIEAVANELGLINIPQIENESNNGEKPDLSNDQILKLQEYYRNDLELYNRAFIDYNKNET